MGSAQFIAQALMKTMFKEEFCPAKGRVFFVCTNSENGTLRNSQHGRFGRLEKPA